MKLKLSPVLVAWVVVYGLAIWGAWCLISFGDARNRQEAALEGTRGMVLGGHIRDRQAWGNTIVGDACFKVDEDPTWYCVQPEYVPADTTLEKIYAQMTIGTPVFVKALRGQVAELILGEAAVNRAPDTPRTIPYNAGVVEAYLAKESRGSPFIYAGVALLALVAGLHLFWLAKRRR